MKNILSTILHILLIIDEPILILILILLAITKIIEKPNNNKIFNKVKKYSFYIILTIFSLLLITGLGLFIINKN